VIVVFIFSALALVALLAIGILEVLESRRGPTAKWPVIYVTSFVCLKCGARFDTMDEFSVHFGRHERGDI
jgi:hypothetical protein